MTMEKISSLISKKVISIEEGSLIGYVLDLVFDEELKTYEGLILVDEESEKTFFLKREDILSVGDDCVMIEDARCLEYDVFARSNNPIGKEVYDNKGACLGRVLEVEVYGKIVKRILTNKCEFPQKYVQKVGENFLIFGLCKRKKKQNFFEKKSIGDIDKLPKVVATSIPIGTTTIQSSADTSAQTRIFSNPNQLLGRVLTNDLIGMNNEIIAKKNEKINKKIINNAKIHNKLNILQFYSK